MIKSQKLFDSKSLNTREKKNNMLKSKKKFKFIPKSKINRNEPKNEEIEEEMEKDDDITKIEKIKIYHNKKRSSQVKDKPIQRLYHNEIDKIENNITNEKKIMRNNSKIKPEMPSIDIINSNQTFNDNNVCVTERTYEKKDELRYLTMTTTPKGKFTNNFRNVISLNKNAKIPKSIISSKSKKNYSHNRNRVKSNDLREVYNEKFSNYHLNTEGNNDTLFIGDDFDTLFENETKGTLLLNNSELNNTYKRGLKTQRQKSLNKSLLIDIINNSDLGNKFFNLKKQADSNQKFSHKNIKNNNNNLFLNKNKIKKEIKVSSNSSQKNIFTPKNRNHFTNIAFNTYKSLSKSRDNTKKTLNKTFYYPKSLNKNSLNSKQNGIFKKNNHINYTKKLFLELKETNKYLAPIIESNIVIENENCRFLENTICAKNKIVNKRKKTTCDEQSKEDNVSLRKTFNLNGGDDKKNNKNNEKNKNDKEKGMYLFTDGNKNVNKLTFTNAVKKLYKKPPKKQQPEAKVKINNIKLQKTYNNKLNQNNTTNNINTTNNTNNNENNNINIKTNNENNNLNNNLNHNNNIINHNNNINNHNNNISNQNNNNNNTNNAPDIAHRFRTRSRQRIFNTRAESIDKSLCTGISNLTAISNTNIFNGKIEDYLITKELGKGSYATVKLAMHKITKKKYAIKIYTRESLLDPQKRSTIKNEINILKQLNHNNIMKLYEVIDTSKFYYLVLEYIKGISLLDIMKVEKKRYIEEGRALKLFTQIVKGIAYCQSKNINHRDIKLENILVLNNDIIKIIDFGFAVKANKETYQTLLCGTPSYMAPEIVSKKDYIAQYSDIWSLGVLLYTMLYGRFPFRAQEDEDLFDLIKEGFIIFPDTPVISDNIKSLIKKIMNVNPRLRPSPEEILNDIILCE